MTVEFSGLKTLSGYINKGNYSSVFILVDENTKKFCLPLLLPYLENFQIIKIKSGEKNKTLPSCEFIWNNLIEGQADRKSLLINLGGGVITDMGAFCAATFMRGINFINIPTTLLAMSDAAIGGKTGIDFIGYKNMIGSFSYPASIIIDIRFLETLPQKQLNAAASELFKHALLQGKRKVNIHLKKSFLSFTPKERKILITNSINFKMQVVTADAKESNLRKQLNLGHTFGHAFESYFLQYHQPILHGEAVALGLVAEAFIAHNNYNLSYDSFLNIVFWYDLNFKKPNLKQLNFNTFINLMMKDKKNINLSMQMIMLETEGKFTTEVISKENIIEALKFIVAF